MSNKQTAIFCCLSWMALIVNVIVVQLEGHSFECTGNRQHSNHMWVEQAVDPQKPSLSSVSYRAKFMSYHSLRGSAALL